MLLAAFLHAGLPENYLIAELGKIPDLACTLSIEDDLRSGIACKQLHVTSDTQQEFRHLPNILQLLQESRLSTPIQNRAAEIFTRLAKAEAKIHNKDVETIHFHEVGAVDTIVDIVGALIGIEYFKITEIYCSPLPMGRGQVTCAHGNLPLPAPAVCELLVDIPVYGVENSMELVTPTGAVLAASLTNTFGIMPPMTIRHTGYGAGSHKDTSHQPNLLRLLIGQKIQVEEAQQVEIIECNLDDWNGEMFPYLCEQLFAANALDITITPLLMKKGRPGHQLQVISDVANAHSLKHIILSETSAIGLRFRREKRITLPRKVVPVSTPWGDIPAKQVEKPWGTTIYPEYEACRKVAKRENIPLSQVYESITGTQEKKN